MSDRFCEFEQFCQIVQKRCRTSRSDAAELSPRSLLHGAIGGSFGKVWGGSDLMVLEGALQTLSTNVMAARRHAECNNTWNTSDLLCCALSDPVQDRVCLAIW